MKNLCKLVFAVLLFTLSNKLSAQRVEIDSMEVEEQVYFGVKNDDEFLRAMRNTVGNKGLVLTEGTSDLYIYKPIVREKKFVSFEEK